MEEQNKSEITYENKLYLGKKLVKSNESGTGKWEKLWKLTFKNGQFEQNITAFDPTGDKSLNIPDLVEGTEYCVGFKITPYQHPEHGTVNAKTLTYIGEKNDKFKSQAPAQTVQSNLTHDTTNTINLVREDAIQFYTEYEKIIALNKLEPSVSQFVGLWYRMNHKQDPVIQTLEKVFNEKNQIVEETIENATSNNN